MEEKIVHQAAGHRVFCGRKIRIEGRTTKCSKRFDVNLECKAITSLPLHISVRFEEGCIVRNTRNQSGWGAEERGGGMPIVRGESFTIELECKWQMFSIYINGSHFCDYYHRLPYETINNMTITRDVEVCDVSFGLSSQQGSNEGPAAEPVVHSVSIPGMFVGRVITIQGMAPASSHRFDINLECTTIATIPLHLSVRFGEGEIVRNTLVHAGWGPEERSGGMPIVRGESFTVEIECKALVFSVTINGSHFCDYKHRLPYETINNMTVINDVDVRDVSMSKTCHQRC